MKLKLLFALLFVAQTVVATNTIPAVNNEENRNGHFTITPKTALVYNSTVRDVAMYLLEYIPFKQILSSNKTMPGDIFLTINRFMDEGQR